MDRISISDGEWKIMKLLWASEPWTLGRLVKALDEETGWTRATVFVMLKRLIAKGVVRIDNSKQPHKYYPEVKWCDITPMETESFINRVYDGSVGMLVSSLAGRNALSTEDIAELRRILDEAENKRRE